MNRLILNLNINLCWNIGEMGDEITFTLPFADKAKELLDDTNNQVLIEKLLTSYPHIISPTISNYGQVLFSSRPEEFYEAIRKLSDPVSAMYEDTFKRSYKLFEELLVEARAIRDLYYACIQARDTPEKIKNALIKCKLLHSAYDFTRQIQAITEKRLSLISPDDLPEAKLHIDRNYGKIMNLPAMVDFHKFLSINEDRFRDNYGFQIRETKPHRDARTKQSTKRPLSTSKVTLNYWDNKDASEDVKLALDVFGYKLGQEHRYERDYENYFTKWMSTKEIAEKYLLILDEFISARLGNVDFHFDSVNRELICTVPSLESALYLRIISDIVSTRDYKECVMCGCLFEATRNNRKYCFRHTDSQINYYRILKRNLKK